MSGEKYLKRFELKNKIAVVTGATGILGRYFCNGLAEAGAHLALVDLEKQTLDSFSDDLEQAYDIQALPVVCDVSNSDSVKKMAASVFAHFGRIDILHNNAATKTKDLKEFFASTEDYSLEAWRQIMSVNLDGMFLVAQAIGSQMVKQKSGSIIQTGSIYGVFAPDQRIYKGSEYLGMEINTPAVYSASKAGVVGLTKYLASLWGAHGVRVNTLVPGGVFSGQNEKFTTNYSARVPMGRMAEPQEMVGPLLFLASDASSYITGQTVMVDGGLSCW